ncbi:hypothetical protein [Fischerella sp. PCC 9605]|uniref:hypothetical protein n=1 Tax=Fischerella sp. PCC 9605 TaxID=1173024 RepID=UPI0006851CD1|nr:hypothetical protein [Fischerella sp. PCC 9605]
MITAKSQFGVSFETIAYFFGRNPMYWYRIYLSLGRASIVGTTIKDPAKLPQHLVGDEKHTWLHKKRVFVPTTAANGCFLGAAPLAALPPAMNKRNYFVESNQRVH